MPTPYVELFEIIYSSLQLIPKSPPVCRIFSANLCFIRKVHILRAGVCRPCIESKLTATKKSATDGN